jgi:cytosine/adenosine deaminase-related metal-dependent hydrolase
VLAGNLLNAHTHLELGCLAHLCPDQAGTAFVPWIGALIAARREISASGELPFQRAVEEGIAQLLASGVVAVGDISATGASVEPLLASGLSGAVYLEVLGLDRESTQRRLRERQQCIEALRRRETAGGLRIGLSIHAPYSCHPELFREGATWCRAESVPLCVHVGESHAERDLLKTGAGGFRALPNVINVADVPAPGCSPVAYLEDLGVLAAQPLLVHCVHVDSADIARIAASGAAVAHCPRSNRLLQCGRMPLEQMLDAGVRVHLGTDSLASSPSLDVREEAAAAAKYHAGKVAPKAVRALLNAELALP